jgi:hypothetical protein
MSLKRVLKGRTPDVWVTINGIPIFLAVNQVRLLEVRGNENGDRALKIEEILKASSSKPILCNGKWRISLAEISLGGF